jgi:hypothetical protein
MPFAPPGWANTTGGAITEARLNDQILRVLLPYYALDQDKDYPTVNFDRYVVDSGDNIYQTGVEAVTLLKNRDRSAGQQGGLPLGKQDVGGKLSLSPNLQGRLLIPIDCCAQYSVMLAKCPSPSINGDLSLPMLLTTRCLPATFLSKFPKVSLDIKHIAHTQFVYSGGGSGWSQAPFLVTPLDAMQERARKDKFYLEHFLL